MHISATAHFPADPARVQAMQTDPDYLAAVCRASGATGFDVAVQGDRTTVTRRMPAPDVARRFVGDTITVVETCEWLPPRSDGSRSARIGVEVPGAPGGMTGSAELAADGTGSTLTVTGELTVRVPLVGRKLEQAAAPAVTAGLSVQEKVARDWLS